MVKEGRLIVAAGEGEVVLAGGFGVVSKVSGARTGGAFSIVEHPLEPGVLGAPPHTHANEDETSFVIEGEIGVMIGGEEVRAGAGSYVFKPRGVPHAFWNPGPEPARILEIISPAGFERYFEELAGVPLGGRPAGPREDLRGRRPLRPHLPHGAGARPLGAARPHDGVARS
jgi:mannose-6-phosphate isomerase-like protein (cupin superfamily)